MKYQPRLTTSFATIIIVIMVIVAILFGGITSPQSLEAKQSVRPVYTDAYARCYSAGGTSISCVSIR